MKSGLTKLAGILTGALLLAGVLLPTTTSGAAPVIHTINQTGCDVKAVANNGGPFTGTSTTSTSRGVTTTKTTYSGEITTSVIAPVGTPAARAKFMASDEAGNEYFAITRALANAVAQSFNRANPGRIVGQGVVYYGRTKFLAEDQAMNNDTMGYVNGVPVTSSPQYLATSRNGTAFFSNCSQARANTLANLDTNRPPKKVFHATNTATGQVMNSAVSAKFANALAAYHYVGYTPGEVAAYGFNCQILTANSYGDLITAFQAQVAAMPFVSYGGDFLGFDTTGTNPADMQMFRGATQAEANALAYAFGKSIVKGGVFVVDSKGTCASVGPNIKEVVAQQNIEQLMIMMDSSSIAFGSNAGNDVTVNVATGMKMASDGSINVGGQVTNFYSFVGSSSTSASWPNFASGTYNATWNMVYYDQGNYPLIANNNPPLASQELTTPFTTAHATLPTQTITCVPYSTALAGAPSSWTGLSYNCPSYYHLDVTP